MENQLEKRIKAFLAVCYGSGSGYGDGYGSGYGSGYGDGDGDGNGDGYGYGDGDGYGYGSGYGYGYGYGDGYGDGYGYGDGDGYCSGVGITEFNGKKVWSIDDILTIIDSVCGNFAKGFILYKDFTLKPCYIAKVDNYFAHGLTLRQAFSDAQSKAFTNEPPQKRIDKFYQEYPDPDIKIPAMDLYYWHGLLTGSCKLGRDHFASERGIDVENDALTVREFIILTHRSYGREIIEKLAKKYGIKIY